MKKVLLVIDNLGSGGAQNQLTLLAKGLQESGHTVHVFTYFGQDFFKKRLEESSIKLIYQPKKTKLGLGVIKALKKLYQTEKYDTVISFLDTPNFYAVAAKKLSRHKPPAIISYRSMTDFGTLSLWSLWLKKWVNRQADWIVSNSYHEQERWLQKFPWLKYKWSVIYNAVSFKRSIEYQTSDEPPIRLLVVGSISSYKNGLRVIEELKILRERGIDFILNWVGAQQNSKERLNYRRRMENLIDEYHLRRTWQWTEPEADIQAIYARHDVLVLASEIEGLPNVVCEAMYNGLICVLSNTLEHPKLIGHDRGFLFDLDRIGSMADSIQRILVLSQEERERIKETAMQYAKREFSLEKFTESYLELIDKLTSSDTDSTKR